MTIEVINGVSTEIPPAPQPLQVRTRPTRHRLWSVLSSPTFRVIGRRLIFGVVLVFVVTGLSFLLVSLIPGDPARAILGVDATQDQVVALRHELGLDLPLYERYWTWLQGAVRGDFGTSISSRQPVTTVLEPRIGVTLVLLAGTLIVSTVIGVALGVAGAVRGGGVGRFVDAISLLGFAVPSFWIAAMAASILAVNMGLFPAAGYVPPSESVGGWLSSITLPVLALSAGGIGVVAKQTREAMLDVLGSEYIRMARASGLPSRSIVFRHALKNASVRVLTVLGLVAVGVLSGTVVVESVFALPGLGGALVDATTRGDYAVVQGLVTYFAVAVVVVNLLIDLAYVWANPKVRVQ
ncbi:MAG: ABC transporter permease [Actinomycetota bacterium]|nr:ABC transporter permease [Actinomycetota bacterium]